MILIKNSQRKIKVNITKLEQKAQVCLDALGYSDFDLGILITTNATIRKFNKQYRHKDKPTDILSFPFHTDLKAGQKIKPKFDTDKNLGDLIISPEYVLKNLAKWGQPFEERLQILLVHGICHLLGYDHETDADYKIMHKKEFSLLKKIKN